MDDRYLKKLVQWHTVISSTILSTGAVTTFQVPDVEISGPGRQEGFLSELQSCHQERQSHYVAPLSFYLVDTAEKAKEQLTA